jgi:hypothetical protein
MQKRPKGPDFQRRLRLPVAVAAGIAGCVAMTGCSGSSSSESLGKPVDGQICIKPIEIIPSVIDGVNAGQKLNGLKGDSKLQAAGQAYYNDLEDGYGTEPEVVVLDTNSNPEFAARSEADVNARNFADRLTGVMYGGVVRAIDDYNPDNGHLTPDPYAKADGTYLLSTAYQCHTDAMG